METVDNLQNTPPCSVTLHSRNCQCRGFGTYLDPGPRASELECSYHNDQNIEGATAPIIVSTAEWIQLGRPRTREDYEKCRAGIGLRVVKRSCKHAQLRIEYRSPRSGSRFVVAKCCGCSLSGPEVDAENLMEDVASRAMEPIVQVTGHNYKWIDTKQPKTDADEIDLIVYFQSFTDGAMV